MGSVSADGSLVAASIPSWALDVLATPGDKQRLHASPEGLAAAGGKSIGVDQGIVDLSGRSQDELRRHAEVFFAHGLDAVEFLRPSQQHFRRLLWRFARQFAPEAIVADIASSDAEFAGYFPTRRVLAMDLSSVCLRRAIQLGRVDFAVLADVRHPPLLDGSLDAIVSSNTLIHLPQEVVPEAVEGLVRCLKPGGMLATTLSSATVGAVVERIGEHRVIERVCIGGPVSQWWERVVYYPCIKTIYRLGSRTVRVLKPVLDLVSSAVSLGDRLVKASPSSQQDSYWLVIRAS